MNTTYVKLRGQEKTHLLNQSKKKKKKKQERGGLTWEKWKVRAAMRLRGNHWFFHIDNVRIANKDILKINLDEWTCLSCVGFYEEVMEQLLTIMTTTGSLFCICTWIMTSTVLSSSTTRPLSLFVSLLVSYWRRIFLCVLSYGWSQMCKFQCDIISHLF